MKTKHFLNLLASWLVILGLFAAATPTFAKSSPVKEIKGLISAVDLATQSITITQKYGSAGVTIKVNTTTSIKRSGLRVTLSSLQVGDLVEAKYNFGTKLASKIEAKLNLVELKGVISAVDSSAGTLTVKNPKSAVEVTITVDATTLIKRLGLRVNLDALQVSDLVEAKYNPITGLANKIEAKLNTVEIKGSVSAVDLDLGTLTVKNIVNGREVTLTVDASTYIKRLGLLATLNDLQVGDLAEVKHNPVTLQAYKIEAKLYQVGLKGSLVASDVDLGTLTIKNLINGTEVLLSPVATALIYRLGLPVTLADLQVGDLLEVKYNPVTLQVYRIEAKLYQVGLKGSLVAADVDLGTLTIKNLINGTEVLLSLDASARIYRLGLPVTLADLKVGDLLEGKYNPVTNLVYSISAKPYVVQLKGSISTVDAGLNTLTVKKYYSTTLVNLTVDETTIITRRGLAITLADILVGNIVEVKYNPVTLLAYNIVVR
ncbi:MAG: DUF5666 domain-containing protein [Chloroflexota bacterium]